MKLYASRAAVVLLSALLCPHAPAQAPAEATPIDFTAALVNSTPITASRVERRIQIAPEAISFETALQIEIDRELLIQAAERDFSKAILDRLRAAADNELTRRLDPRRLPEGPLARTADSIYQDFLITTYFDRKCDNATAVTPAALRAHYEQHIADYTIPETVTIRQIMVRLENHSPEDARVLIESASARLVAGEDFADLAKELSEGPYASAGGLWPAQPRGSLVAAVDQAAFSTSVGDVSPPIDTPLGIHLVKVQERRDLSVVPFAEIQQEITDRLLQSRKRAARAQLIGRLRSAAVIKIDM